MITKYFYVTIDQYSRVEEVSSCIDYPQVCPDGGQLIVFDMNLLTPAKMLEHADMIELTPELRNQTKAAIKLFFYE